MTRRIFGMFGIKLYHCTKLPQQGGTEALVDLVQGLGGTFLYARKPDPDARQANRDEHGLWPTEIRHELFAGGERPSLGFVQDTRSVSVGCDISFVDPRWVDATTSSFLRFAELIYPHLGPAYGWLDEVGERLYRGQDVPARKLAYIFWANFFGPPYVEKYGRDFLLGAPGWRVEELSDGGILYVISPSFVKLWEVVKPKQVLHYFQQVAPKVRLYRWVSDKFLE
ncbi:MAG: hypothetical protein HY675_03705 [Chloroflexi bacterium]|nr:hypothetical protein [Chloroflexota bacterium]